MITVWTQSEEEGSSVMYLETSLEPYMYHTTPLYMYVMVDTPHIVHRTCTYM